MRKLILICLTIQACADNGDSIYNTVYTYAIESLKEIDNTIILDSLSITGIDSFSSLDDLRFKINNANDSLIAIMKAGTRESILKDPGINSELNKIDSMLFLASSGTVDSTDFLYYVAKTRICITDKAMVQRCSNGFTRVTKNYRIIPTKYW